MNRSSPDVPSPPVPQDPRLLQGVAQVLWRRKLPALAGAVLGLVAGAALYALTPPAYSSSAQLLIIKGRPEGVGVEPGSAAPEDFVATHQGLLKSPLLMERAIKLGNLRERPAFQSSENLVQDLLKRLTVARNKDSMGMATNIVTLSFRDRRGDDCNAVLEALIRAYRETLDEVYTQASDTVLDLLRKAQTELNQDLIHKAAEYRKFREESPLLLRGRDVINLGQERLVNLETKRTAVMLRQTEVQGQQQALEKAVASKQDREVLLAMVADFAPNRETEAVRLGQTGKWQEQVLSLLQQEQKLLERYGPDHPEVQSLQQQITTARDFLTKPSAPLGSEKTTKAPFDPVQWRLQSLRQELEQLQVTERLLTEISRHEQAEARKTNGFEVQEETFRNEIARTQQLFETVVKRLQNASMVKDVGGFEARVIAAPGSSGVLKVQPSGLILGSFALVLGLSLAGGMAWLSEWTDSRFSSLGDMQARLGLPVVGQIPKLVGANAVSVAPLLTLQQRSSMGSEAIRAWRTAVLAALRDGDRKVVLVASPRSGEGKTFLAANLAVSLAQASSRVLLLDGNLRDPRLAQVFSLPAGPGLADLLRGGAHDYQAIRGGPVPTLHVLPVEPMGTDSADLISSPAFSRLLASLKAKYDVILVDSPPLLAVADGAALALHADASLLVLRDGVTSRADAERSQALLEENNASILGIVVNGVRGSGGFSGYRDVQAQPTPQTSIANESTGIPLPAKS